MGEEKQGASWDAQLLVKTEDKSIRDCLGRD